MADDPGHKVMLYFLETLMYSTVPLTISQLAGRFGSRNFTPEMRQAAGGNESGLKKFLLKYPSLFTVNGNLVSLNDGTASLGGNFRESSPASSSGQSLPDVSIETEAVQYFRSKMMRKGETMMPVASLAGHLSQASVEIRECVGPQNKFTEWILKHPLIFDVKDDIVSLKDNVTYSAVNPNAEPIEDLKLTSSIGALDPLVLPSQHTPRLKRRPKSLDVAEMKPPTASPKTPTTGSKPGPVTMTANEYKAVMFIKGIIEKKGDMKINSLSGNFNQAPESLRNTIGWGKQELEKFIRTHSNIFTISEDGMVSVIKNTRLNVIITGSRPQVQAKPTVTSRKGKVYHVAKLWGIIDLGKHEHVFIDRTIFGKHIDDLNKLLRIGETVCFDAIPASKGSRARWRATKVWKEHESIEDLIEKVAAKLDLQLDGTPKDVVTPVSNIEEEMRKAIPDMNDSTEVTTPLTIGGIKYAFSDAAPSGAGVIPVWNFKPNEVDGLKGVEEIYFSDEEEESPQLTMVAERYYMNKSVVSDSPREVPEKKEEKMTNGTEKGESPRHKTQVPEKKTAEIACQTIVTGDILATQLYHENI
ncbi:egalitarian protein homolog [Haliotis rufescens]|uniref:egalitarian protein homolog n=1 Tax=Haliotis rufescens TaxID=6454 RepID=UPI001EB07225|nr:egalitarian protein homolog [Haliotis rufescens]